MRLDIIVPHYKEPWETCKYLFDSLALQRGVSLNNIRVLLVNDGDCMLDKDFSEYPYKVEYLAKEHGGVSSTRNYGLDHSDADYVMFCDIDDGFLSTYGLHLVFSAMQEGFDVCVSNFVEETFDEKGNATIVRHDKDLTFMHGKVYRREFLVENDLRFDPSMNLHEDGYFNVLTYSVATEKGKTKNIESPFYLWRWNDNSVVRSNRQDFVLRTYKDVILTRIGVCRQLKARGLEEAYRTSVGMTVLNSYYDFQKDSYYLPKNEKYLRIATKSFKEFWDEFKPVFIDLNNRQVADMARVARENAYKNGMLFEKMDLRTFLRSIEAS